MVLTNAGKYVVADLLLGRNNSGLTYVAWGAGSNVADPSNTSLGSELQRNAFTSLIKETAIFQTIHGGILGSGQANLGSILEIGLFTASGLNAGSCFGRQQFVRINKTSDLELQEEWFVRYGQI